ncbi:hypothetical protein [Limnohabitans sp.]
MVTSKDLSNLPFDDKQRETDCPNSKGLFRIIEPIPSPKASPLKRALAQVGYERVKEIEKPELASAHAPARELFQAKGCPQAGSKNGGAPSPCAGN